MNPNRVPVSLLFQQGPMLKTLGGIAVGSLLPGGNKRNPEHFEPASVTLPAPSAKLVANYIRWSGGEGRYHNELPPHLFCQWALPVATRVIKQSRYKLAGIINQGVSMQVNAPLPAGEPIEVTASLASLTEENNRARMSIEIASGTAGNPRAVVAQMHVTFILGPKLHQGQRKETPAPDWEAVGDWQASGNDGLNFALLTGDFNPIHWIGAAGRASAFKSKVLHGFGMFVRSYEVLASQGPIREIDVRFLSPVTLPSNRVRVEEASVDTNGQHPLRLVGNNDKLHLIGSLKRMTP